MKRGNEGQGRGATTDTIRHVLNMIETNNATRKAEEEKYAKENKRYEKSQKTTAVRGSETNEETRRAGRDRPEGPFPAPH